MSGILGASENKIGILLSNLGTPRSLEVSDIRAYLKQFLMDPYVIDINLIARWALVNLLILPKRPHAASEAYQKIWTSRGSPLLFHTLDLKDRLAEKLGPDYAVSVGMRYGTPSIESAVNELHSQGVSEIRFYPLYPQYSFAATSSSIEEFDRVCKKLKTASPRSVFRHFYSEPEYIHAMTETIRAKIGSVRLGDYVLFSFHGVPERQLAKASDCYREHSYATASSLQKTLGLSDSQAGVSFQSRLGRTKWIEPYTDIVLPGLAKRSDIKRLILVSASFTADCLETIEELGIRARIQFEKEKTDPAAEFVLVPSLNSDEVWVDALKTWVTTNR